MKKLTAKEKLAETRKNNPREEWDGFKTISAKQKLAQTRRQRRKMFGHTPDYSDLSEFM